jgi:hypothetical protein
MFGVPEFRNNPPVVCGLVKSTVMLTPLPW